MRLLRVNTSLITLYFWIEDREGKRLNRLIEKRKDISAWYCPTLFWPSVTQLKSPLLICAPDLVMHHFPVGFAIHALHTVRQFSRMVETLRLGKYFTTYSDDVKENTLVEIRKTNPENIFVIHHGANRLDETIDLHDKQTALELLNQALSTARKEYYSERGLKAGQFQFIFYASQARPNKNIFNLLKAYQQFSLKNQSRHKLIMTGNPNMMPELEIFIHEHHLDENVLWLNKMSTKQLAACYHLAELSVNPTFSEGGFPFTFTESLSVGTPVIMSRINVTEEFITDPDLNQMMLFDPYDWKEMANKIEWALQNKETLLQNQLPLYKQLEQRTWNDVVKDYVKVLDHISEQGAGA